MKLLRCCSCGDIVRVPPNSERRPCACGKSWARYVDDECAEVGGPGDILGIDTGLLARAVRQARGGTRSIDWQDRPACTAFVGFVAPAGWATVQRVS